MPDKTGRYTFVLSADGGVKFKVKVCDPTNEGGVNNIEICPWTLVHDSLP